MSDINKKLDLIKEEFSIFSDPRDKYIYLVDLAKASKGLSPNDKLEDNRVQGCTSQAWVVRENKDDQLYFKTDSDAMIVKGLLSLIERSFNGHTPSEIIEIDGSKFLYSFFVWNFIFHITLCFTIDTWLYFFYFGTIIK